MVIDEVSQMPLCSKLVQYWSISKYLGSLSSQRSFPVTRHLSHSRPPEHDGAWFRRYSSGGGSDFAPGFDIGPAAGSVVFAVLYAITLLYYLRRTIDNTTYVFIMLSFFCASGLLNTAFIGDHVRLTVRL